MGNAKVKRPWDCSVVYGEESIHAFNKEDLDQYELTKSNIAILLVVVATLVVLMTGLIKYGWGGYGELCGLF